MSGMLYKQVHRLSMEKKTVDAELEQLRADRRTLLRQLVSIGVDVDPLGDMSLLSIDDHCSENQIQPPSPQSTNKSARKMIPDTQLNENHEITNPIDDSEAANLEIKNKQTGIPYQHR